MSTVVDNIIIGTPLVELHLLGVTEEESTLSFGVDELKNDKGELFLPAILTKVGFFKSNGQVRQINKQRQQNEKFKNNPDQNLWRNLNDPEFTEFKIGKRVFWLIVGE